MRSQLALLACITTLPCVASNAVAQSTSIVSVDNTGAQGAGSSSAAGLSASGALAVFTSAASSFVAGDTNGLTDVFVRDLAAGTTRRVSVDSSGAQAAGSSGSAFLAANGGHVAFASDAANLVSGDTNGSNDIFVHDLAVGTTIRASVSAAGAQATGHSYSPSISADGRFVAFTSSAPNLVLGDTNGVDDVFVKDVVTGSITRISVDSAGTQANDESGSGIISANGMFVAFDSRASNLVAGDTNGYYDVFLYDRINALTSRVSVSSGGTQGSSASQTPRVSSDGRSVSFISLATNMVPGDTNAAQDIFLRDTVAGITLRVSTNYTGQQLPSSSYGHALSGNGQFLAYVTSSPVLPGGGNVSHVYLRSLTSSSCVRISAASGGLPGNNSSSGPWLSEDGSHALFESYSTNLIPADTNNAGDVFASDLSEIWAYVCAGDASGTPCPCGNNAAPGSRSGCINSTGQGAKLEAQGVPSIASDSFVLHGSQMTNGTCLYIQGTAALNTGLGVVLGDGLRCAGGNVIRLAIKVNTAGASQYPVAGDTPVSIQGLCVPGVVHTYQIWHRDGAAFCAPERYNLTNGLSLTWRP